MPSSTAAPFHRTLTRLNALADETRLRIVYLLRRGERCVCELADALAISQPLLSFHLKTLRDAGLVRARREGRWMYYMLDPTVLERTGRELGDLASAYREHRRVRRAG